MSTTDSPAAPVTTNDDDATPGTPPVDAPTPDPITAAEWTLDAALGNVGDGSKIAEGFDVLATRALLAKNVKSIKRTLGSYTNACKALAATRCQARQAIIGPNGRPDWQAESNAYREVIASAEDWTSFSTEDARAAKENVKKHIQRGVLMDTIVAYVREHVTDKGGESLADAADDDIRLYTAVRDEYLAAGLTPPTKYGGKEKDPNTPTGGRGNTGDDTDAKGIVTRLAALDGVATMAHVAAAALALKSIATLVGKLPAGEIAERETVDAMVTETYVLAGLAHKHLTGEATEDTAAATKTALGKAAALLAAVKE